MTPVSRPVLVVAAVLTGPALWGAFIAGTTSTDTALTRFVVAAVVTWLAFGALEMLVGPAPRRSSADEQDADQDAEATTRLETTEPGPRRP